MTKQIDIDTCLDQTRRKGAAPLMPSVSVWGKSSAAITAASCLDLLGYRVVPVTSDMSIETVRKAIQTTDITFVYAGTSQIPDGGRDFTSIEMAACAIGRAIANKRTFHAVVLRTPVPPGTALGIVGSIIECVSGRDAGEAFGLAVHAVPCEDADFPEEVFDLPANGVGAGCARTASLLRQLMAPVHPEFVFTTVPMAERSAWH